MIRHYFSRSARSCRKSRVADGRINSGQICGSFHVHELSSAKDAQCESWRSWRTCAAIRRRSPPLLAAGPGTNGCGFVSFYVVDRIDGLLRSSMRMRTHASSLAKSSRYWQVCPGSSTRGDRPPRLGRQAHRAKASELFGRRSPTELHASRTTSTSSTRPPST